MFVKPKKMKYMNLKKIMDSAKLEPAKVAQQLFPDHKHPRHALNRIISGRTELDAKQLSKLAAMAGVEPGELFKQTWTATARKNTLIFTNDLYYAELDTDTFTTNLFHNGSLFHTFVLSVKSVPLNEYLSTLNSLITKIKKDELN